MTAVLAAGPEVSPSGRRIGRIPVRNLWLLMLYASDLARGGARFFGAVEDMPDDIAGLVARLLADQVERRLRRNLSHGYIHRERTLTRVRGRIDALRTETRQLLARGEVHCRFEELTVDTPRNRLVRAALDRVSRLVENADLARRCRGLAAALGTAGVGGLRPSRAELAADQIGRNDDADRVMVALARLAFDMALLTEEAGPTAMLAPDREEAWVRRLFEKAVLGFARVEFAPQGWAVAGGTPLSWSVEAESPGLSAILPGMVTDIVLRPPAGPRLVIDTKFTGIHTKGQHGLDRLRSGYLYQLYAYLRTQETRPGWADAAGLLLHPAIEETVHEWAVIQGHTIHVATVDLAAPTAAIRQCLADTLRTCAEGAP